ncbi:hypothetical protein HMN09_00123400 [Mycena chlorophos]|uniref:Uncharacterized protein n=1 Tax=Mycena chlorophos TaxID=658473 RepID=A0A8H6TXD0_MYCCL|nr:hypothetical protein HMN09_00123400 [Mycena chlorophos]
MTPPKSARETRTDRRGRACGIHPRRCCKYSCPEAQLRDVTASQEKHTPNSPNEVMPLRLFDAVTSRVQRGDTHTEICNQVAPSRSASLLVADSTQNAPTSSCRVRALLGDQHQESVWVGPSCEKDQVSDFASENATGGEGAGGCQQRRCRTLRTSTNAPTYPNSSPTTKPDAEKDLKQLAGSSAAALDDGVSVQLGPISQAKHLGRRSPSAPEDGPKASTASFTNANAIGGDRVGTVALRHGRCKNSRSLSVNTAGVGGASSRLLARGKNATLLLLRSYEAFATALRTHHTCYLTWEPAIAEVSSAARTRSQRSGT